jgi:hypothetical protein
MPLREDSFDTHRHHTFLVTVPARVLDATAAEKPTASTPSWTDQCRPQKRACWPICHGYLPRELGLDRRACGKLGSSFVDGSTTPPAPASSSQPTAERPSRTAPPSATVLFPACRARTFALVWRHGGECRGGGADVCYGATATSLSGVRYRSGFRIWSWVDQEYG